MLASLFFLLLGLAGLYVGADWLVRGAARIAAALRVPPLVIGLTIVAFGTSAPELVVCVVAAAQGNTDVSLGNVLGSNIANIGLILPLAALVSPIRVSLKLVRRELPLMLAATIVFYALAWRLRFERWEGLLFLLALVGFTALALRWAVEEPPAVAAEFKSFQHGQGLRRHVRYARDLGLLASGLLLLVVGGHLLVGAGVELAQRAGISELVIAATVVAVGSSLPELATAIAAALRNEADILVGNLVGSNLFNILGALGLSALVRPVPVDASLRQFEFLFLLVFTAAMAVVLHTGHRVSRGEGLVLLAGYAAFVLALFLR